MSDDFYGFDDEDFMLPPREQLPTYRNAFLEASAIAKVAMDEVERLQDALVEAIRSIELILPLAKGYGPVGQSAEARATCQRWIEHAEAFIQKHASPSEEPSEEHQHEDGEFTSMYQPWFLP